MIKVNDIKSQKIFGGEDRAYRVYIGEDMVFSSYVIPTEYIFIGTDGVATSEVEVKSNTEWEAKL